MENTVVATQSISLSREVDTEDFDLQAGETWIYPTNYPTRDYQYNLIQKALLKNTLVSLPTGLGKTFIAAVVMYNFYRWYPLGKIIFMAPTKPLVKQQVDACYNIMAIPPEVTAELTGAKASSARTNIWTEKRVFFVTPQVLQNDLNTIAELGSKIKCLVFDEAHKAKGNHAYCEVIRRLLAQNHKYFRVLALSATPGSNVNDVLEVIQNLLISHIEFRTEESLDVAPYVFQRSLETVVVPLSKKLEEVRDEYLQVLERYVKTLIKFNVVHGNCGSLTKGKIFMVMKEFQNKNRGAGSSNYSEIMRCLNICVTLYHAFELLIRHGLRNFLSFYDEHIEKPLLRGNTQLRYILNNVREYLGPIPNIEVLPDGTYPEIPKDIVFGHPKYYKLRDVLVSHFSQAEKNTRVIVFFEYRESVMEAHTMLLQSRPLIQPKIFLGQGSGITQKVQIGVVKAFREGRCNTLLSTCIGEEGLDVGEVDLIICFDISNKSPIRMVQRMGRTGRKREGRIVVLVTEGREQQTLKDCLIHKNNISTYVLESKQLHTGMYPDSPRLVPKNLTPRCEKMFITVKKIQKKNSIKDMLRSLSSNSSGPVFSQEVNVLDIQERIPKTTMLFDKGHRLHKEKNLEKNHLFYRFIEKQRSTQKTHKVKNSKDTKILTELLRSADSKRFNIPTQIQNLTQGNAGKNLKQSDIRNMFFKKTSQLDFQPSQRSTEVLDVPTQIIVTQSENHVDISDETNIPKELFSLVSNYLFTQMANPLTECRHCPRGFRCEDFAVSTAPCLLTNNNWVPSEDILDTISLTDLENFSKFLDPTHQSAIDSSVQLDQSELSQLMDNVDSRILNNINFTQLEKEAEINSKDKIVELEKSFNFEAPKTYSNILNKFGNSIFLSQETTQVEKDFDNKIVKKHSTITENSLLEFFKWESLSLPDTYNPSPNSSQSTVIYSQTFSDLDTNENNLCNISKSPSPILSLEERKKKYIKTKTAQRIGNSSLLESQMESDDFTVASPLKRTGRSQNLTSYLQLTKSDNNFKKQVNSIDINDFCDLSYFGLSNSNNEEIEVSKSKVADIEQICDLSQFGILTDDKNERSKQDGGLAKKCITDNTDSDMTKTANTNESANLFDDILSLNNYIKHSNNFCDNLYEKTSTPLNKTHSLQASPSCLVTMQNNSPVKDLDQTFIEMDFNLPTQDTDSSKKYDSNRSKSNFTQKNSCIDDYEESDCFSLATQPYNSKKPDILTRSNNAPENQDKYDSSAIEKEIECVDLTLFSPTSANEKCISSGGSQIAITQMLCLLNKTTQKENLKDDAEVSNITLTRRKVASSKLNNGKTTWLSTKKNTHNEKISNRMLSKSAPKKETDPYLFPMNFKNAKEKTVDKGSTSSDEFEDSLFLKPNLSSVIPQKKLLEKNRKYQKKHCKKQTNDFLDLEAQLSDDENLSVSEDEDEENDNFYEKSFVNDETLNLDTQMHAKYLQSIRSPANPGRFKIPLRPTVNISNVYSQLPSTEVDTYLEDSFCVDTDDSELTQKHELSQLEILEKQLRRKKKRKKSDEKDLTKPKRRRVICFASDDSD